MTRTTNLNFPGIYGINCSNGFTYIGKAVNIRKRWMHHRWRLNNQTHDNAHMQKAWNKYGSDAFVFEVRLDLRHLSGDELNEALTREEIAHEASLEKSFNLMRAGEGGFSASPETRAKLSAAHKARWADPEYRARAVASMRAKAADPEHQARRGAAISAAKSTPERRAKMAAQSSARWEDPTFQALRSSERLGNWADPHYREQQSKTRKSGWTDPEAKARRLRAMQAGRGIFPKEES